MYPGKRLEVLTDVKETPRPEDVCMALGLSNPLRNDRQDLSYHFGFSFVGENRGGDRIPAGSGQYPTIKATEQGEKDAWFLNPEVG